MRSIDQWLDAYGESHQNPVNKRIHWICVPLIVFSLVGLLWSVPHPFSGLGAGPWGAWLNWGTLFLLAACVYYVVLSRTLAFGMILIAALVSWGNALLAQAPAPLWAVSLAIFTAAWIGQFIGHKIEGKKPSFFEDLLFLLIGPLWCLAFLYTRLGIPYAPPKQRVA